MSKETNHRRKAKVARKVEELDIDKLTKELVKPRRTEKNRFDGKYKGKKNGKPYNKGKGKYKNDRNK